MGKVIAFLLVGLVVLVSAKPYESYRKTSAPNQYSVYPLYGRNVLLGTDRIPYEYLERLFDERSKEASMVLSPFVRLPDELPNDRFVNEEDPLLIDPMLDEKYPDSPVYEIDEDIVEEREKPNKPSEKPKEDVSDKEQLQDRKEEKPNANGEKYAGSPVDEIDGDIVEEREKTNKPDQKPKEDIPDREQEQDETREIPNENSKGKEPNKHEKRPKPGHPLITKPPHKGNRPGMEKPSKDLPRRDPSSPQQPGTNDRRDGPSQPPSPPRRQPEAPLVQINVNVASPTL